MPAITCVIVGAEGGSTRGISTPGNAIKDPLGEILKLYNHDQHQHMQRSWLFRAAFTRVALLPVEFFHDLPRAGVLPKEQQWCLQLQKPSNCNNN